MSTPDPENPGSTSPDLVARVSKLYRAILEMPLTPIGPNPEYICPPRLGIIHLLAWMTVAAVLFGINESLRFSQAPLTYRTFIGMFYTIFRAAGLVGAGVLINTKRRQSLCFFQPAHWLLLYISLATMVNLVYVIALRFILTGIYGYPITIISLCELVFQVFCLFWIASRIREPGRWKNFYKFWAWFIIGSIILSLFIYLISSLFWYQSMQARFIAIIAKNIYELVPLIFLVTVAGLDLSRGERRDWLHWLAVFIFVSENLILIVSNTIHVFEK
jgi:hypothetical protein